MPFSNHGKDGHDKHQHRHKNVVRIQAPRESAMAGGLNPRDVEVEWDDAQHGDETEDPVSAALELLRNIGSSVLVNFSRKVGWCAS